MIRSVQPKSLTAFEHQAIPVGAEKGATAISAQEATRLALLSKSRPGFCTLGYQSLQLAQYAGLVGMGDRVLEILPKVENADGVPEVGRGIFLRLLGLSKTLKIFADDKVDHDLRRQSLLDVFIAAYFDAIASLVRTGLLRRYQSSEEDLTLIRGRLLIERQAAAHAMRVDRLACRFDDLTADNIWNQCLKAALHAVRPWISSIDLGRRWLELSATLDEVSLRAVTPATLDALMFDRQSTRYKPAIEWATWILRVVSPNLRVGQNAAPGLIFDMNQLFQSAIVTLLRRRAAAYTNLQVSAQDTGTYLTTLAGSDGLPAFGLRPDIVIRDAAEVLIVGDTKWSRVDVGPGGYLMPQEAHMYQMQAYAAVYPCERFSLIYPWHEGLRGSRPTAFTLPSIGGRKPVVGVTCVDVSSDAFNVTSKTSGSTLDKLLERSEIDGEV